MQRGLVFSSLLFGLIVLVILASSGSNISAAQQRATAPPTNTPRGAVTTIGPFQYPDNINPLNGLPYPNEEARNRRNLILKISNFPEVVRPQHGLSAADLIFEYEAEGGVTRFAAIYRSQAPERAGSVRSARLVDIELVTAYQALLAYSGSNDWIREYILESDWRWRALSPQIGNNCPAFCRIREDNRAFEHTLFANVQAIWDEAERLQVNQGLIAWGMTFSETPLPSDQTANDIFIDWFSPRANTRWQYNPADNLYYRWDSGLPHIDAATDEQLTADNVILLEAWHVDRPDVYESEIGGIALEHLVWGRGRAWIFRDGLWYEGQWLRNQERGGFQFRFPDSDVHIPLKPGQTWIEIVRQQSQYPSGDFFSVTVGQEYEDAEATAVFQSDFLTSVPAATQTQFAEWYGSPTPSATWTPTPTGTWQY